jgi:hypothetical protein
MVVYRFSTLFRFVKDMETAKVTTVYLVLLCRANESTKMVG